MAVPHTRRPNELSPDQYGIFCKNVKDFMGGAKSLPNRPEHLVASQLALADVYIAALDAMNLAKTAQIRATESLTNALTAVYEKLVWFQTVLPSLTLGDTSILIEFGLAGEMPKEDAKLRNLADEVWAYWLTVAADPLYAPMAVKAAGLGVLITAHEAAEDAQIAMIAEYAARQNAKDNARAAHHEVERAIFNWYRAEYPKGDEIYWEQTPWGKVPDGGAEPSVPIPDWPGPGAFSGSYRGQKQVELIYGPVKDATHCDIDVKPHNESEWVVLFNDITMDPEKIVAMRELNVEEGKYDYRLVPYKDEEKGLNAEITVDVKD